MNYSEEQRIYQCSLEFRRTAREQLAGTVSFDEELADIESIHAEVESHRDVAYLSTQFDLEL